jgi:hypothetical protein
MYPYCLLWWRNKMNKFQYNSFNSASEHRQKALNVTLPRVSVLGTSIDNAGATVTCQIHGTWLLQGKSEAV